MSAKPDPNDPTTWPIVDAVPSDVFLGEFVHDCTPHLTDEQRSWPVVQCEPTDVFLGVFTDGPAPAAPTPPPATPEQVAPPADQSQPAP